MPRAVRITLPSQSSILYNGYVTLNKTPTLTKNEIMGLQATVSLTSEPMRYSA
ncbi:Phage tail protein [compost metagenome]